MKHRSPVSKGLFIPHASLDDKQRDSKQQDTHCDTNRNIIASNALLAEFLKTKLAAMPREYTLVNDLTMLTPKTDKEMKNKMMADMN